MKRINILNKNFQFLTTNKAPNIPTNPIEYVQLYTKGLETTKIALITYNDPDITANFDL